MRVPSAAVVVVFTAAALAAAHGSLDGTAPTAGGVAPAGPTTLVDHPIASGLQPVYFDGGSWTASSAGGPQDGRPPLPATVPGDILSDLQQAGRVGDPYYNTTWRQPDFIAAWNNGTWTYKKTFSTPTSAAASYLLVFDGIRMGATIALNGVQLGNATNQFLRYMFSATGLKPAGDGQNVLELTFGDDSRGRCSPIGCALR